MGLLDNVLASAVPQGNASKPLKIALGALLASGALFKTASAGRHENLKSTRTFLARKGRRSVGRTWRAGEAV